METTKLVPKLCCNLMETNRFGGRGGEHSMKEKKKNQLRNEVKICHFYDNG